MEMIFNAGKFVLDLSEKTYVMGILNVTSDSFFDGNKWVNVDAAVNRALQMQAEGADIIDIGAQSTRPGCTQISPAEELERLLPVLTALSGQIRVPISVDTFYPEVAQSALKLGVDIINDVTGFKDDKMVNLAAESNCGCIVMHDGANCHMKDFFTKQLEKMTNFGIAPNRICFDPGIGFGKTYAENLDILKNSKKYFIPGCAMLVGASRKRVIGEACGNIGTEERLPGTIAAHTIAISSGANIIRVHDVKEAVLAAKMADAILKA